MSRLAVPLLALATLTAGCAAMKTSRGTGAQIQRTAQPEQPLDNGSLDSRPDLGQR